MRIWKFLAVILSLLIFVDLISLMFVLMKLNLDGLIMDNKFLVRIIFFIGGAYIAGAFYRYLKGANDNEDENHNGDFEVTRNKLIAIGIAVFIPLVSFIYLIYF